MQVPPGIYHGSMQHGMPGGTGPRAESPLGPQTQSAPICVDLVTPPDSADASRDQSFGLTDSPSPTKPEPPVASGQRRGRDRSATPRPKAREQRVPLTRRTVSSTGKRTTTATKGDTNCYVPLCRAPRAASAARPPSALALSNRPVQNPAALAPPPPDASSERRLQALEQQRGADHALLESYADAIRMLQVHAQHQQEQVAHLVVQANEQTHMGVTIRREIASVRDTASLVAKPADAQMPAVIAMIEAKFGQLDNLVAQLNHNLTDLSNREANVEHAVQATQEAKPQDGAAIAGAFNTLDQRVTQVSELVKRFGGAGATTLPQVAGGTPFTAKMREDMFHMHNKLMQIDSEMQATITQNTAPLFEQLATLHAKSVNTDEYIAYVTTAVSALQTQGANDVPATNPWADAPAPTHGTPASSADPNRTTMNALTGGNGICHCVHVTELQKRVAALETAATRGHDPLSGAGSPWPIRGAAAADPTGAMPAAAPSGPPPGRGASAGSIDKLPLDLRDGLGSIAHKDRPIFDMKMALQEEYKFNGVKDGNKWKERIEGYFISCAPVLMSILAWVERQDNEVITVDWVQAAVGPKMTHEQVLNSDAQLWGFLRAVVSGSAETMFRRATRLHGYDAWRRLIRHVDQGREIRLSELRRNMKFVQMKPIKNLSEVEQGVAEFENKIQEFVTAGGDGPSEEHMKDDLMQMLPEKIQSDLMYHSKHKSISFSEFRDLVVMTSARLLSIQRPTGRLQGVDEEHKDGPPPALFRPPAGAEEDGIDFNAMLAGVSDVEGLVAAFQKYQRGRTQRPPNPRSAPRSDRDPNAPKPDRGPRKCPNCGEEHGDGVRVCPKAAVAVSERPCWLCKKVGHMSRDCPSKKAGGLKAITDGPLAAVAALKAMSIFAVHKAGFTPARHTFRGRPTPRTFTVSDYITHGNRFAALDTVPPPPTAAPPTTAPRTAPPPPPTPPTTEQPFLDTQYPVTVVCFENKGLEAPATPADPAYRDNSNNKDQHGDPPTTTEHHDKAIGSSVTVLGDPGSDSSVGNSVASLASQVPTATTVAMKQPNVAALKRRLWEKNKKEEVSLLAELQPPPDERSLPLSVGLSVVQQATMDHNTPTTAAAAQRSTAGTSAVTALVHSGFISPPTTNHRGEKQDSAESKAFLRASDRSGEKQDSDESKSFLRATEHMESSAVVLVTPDSASPALLTSDGVPDSASPSLMPISNAPPPAAPACACCACRHAAPANPCPPRLPSLPGISLIEGTGPPAPTPQLIAAAIEAHRIRVAMDSAAVANVIHPDELPDDVEFEPNLSNEHFVGANDSTIERYGTATTLLTGKKGTVGCDWDMANVSRPLHSVAKVAGPESPDKSCKVPGKHDVLFDNDDCYVVAPGVVKAIMKYLSAVAHYERDGNLYLADMTVARFPRPGQAS